MIGTYVNGNYRVEIYEDGTKIRETLDPNATEFVAQFPESMDVKITNKCDMNCAMCHENSTIDGEHGDLLNSAFIDSLRPFTEMAIGGGNPLAHPNLEEFLEILKSKNIVASMTVNQTHFMREYDRIKRLAESKLIYGIGVSFHTYSAEFVEMAKSLPNVVLHVINGVVNYSDLRKMYGEGLKLLILGYKMVRRGIDFYNSHNSSVEFSKNALYNKIENIINGFKVVSFDNLAIKQLDIRRILSEEEWNEFYMGDDGSHTMYIDLVRREFSKSSTTKERFALTDDINDMFAVVKTM